MAITWSPFGNSLPAARSNSYIFSQWSGPTSGNVAVLQVQNPIGSSVEIRVKKIVASMEGFTSAVVLKTTGIGTFAQQDFRATNISTLAADSIAQCYATSLGPAAGGGEYIGAWYMNPYSERELFKADEIPIILKPGRGIRVVATTINVSFVATFSFEEWPL